MKIESENEEIQPQDESVSPAQERKSPALTLVIQSWATPIVGIFMLVAGLLGGYFGRPLLLTETSTMAVEESGPVDNDNAVIVISTPGGAFADKQQELMSAIVENTRHFRGEPDAPVTIVEFSDFQ